MRTFLYIAIFIAMCVAGLALAVTLFKGIVN